MKRLIPGLASVLAALTWGVAAQAATYYVSDCAAGAHPSCVPGNDLNAGTVASAPWKTTTKVEQRFSTLIPGDTIRFASGGAWENAQMTLENRTTSNANRITVDSYAPAWGGKARPILRETRPGFTVFNFWDSATPEPDSGYVVQNLDLRGGGTGNNGVAAMQATGDIRLSNLSIDGFSIGVYCTNEIENVQLLNSTLTNNRNQGILWSCNNSLVEGNTFDGNGAQRPVFDHAIYLSGTAARNIVVRGNTLLNTSLNKAGQCEAAVIVVHGVQDGLTIENNFIHQESGTSTGGCWGIAVDPGYGGSEAESARGVVIRGNTIVNVGGIGIGCAGCVAPLIENNVIVQESTPDLTGIVIPDRVPSPPAAAGVPPVPADTGAIIRNNSIYFATTPTYSQGISLASQTDRNGVTATAGTNLQVVSNLIYFAAGSSSHQCFDTSGLTPANFVAFDNNLCYHAGGDGRYSAEYTLTQARGLGWDNAGSTANPLLKALPSEANNWVMVPLPGSPAVNAAHATRSAPKDRRNTVRTTPDIGAYEVYTDLLAPSAPSGASVR